MALPEDKRAQLDGIVSQMEANGEPEGNVSTVVSDFKEKYSEPESYLHPSLTKYFNENKGKISPTTALYHTISDILGIPTRALATVRGQSMADPEANIFKPEMDEADNPNKPTFMGLPRNVAAPIEKTVLGVAGDPTIAIGGVGSLLKKGPEKIVPATAKIGSMLSRVAPEALTEASTKVGREGMKAAAEGADEMGPKLGTAIEDFSKNLPEKKIIDEAIPKMGKVNIQSAIDALENAKPKAITGKLSPEQLTVSKKIDQYLSFLKGKNRDRALQVTAPDKALNGRALLTGEGIDGAQAVKASEAPDEFSSGGLLYKKIKSEYGNAPAYEMPNGKKMQFRGDETFHLDPNQPEALKTAGRLNDSKVIPGAANPDRNAYSAADALEIRKVLDAPIDFGTGLPHPKEVQGALFKARTALKKELENAAEATGNPQYSQAMKDLHKKLDIKQTLEDLTQNGSDIGSDKKAQNFLASVWKKTPDAKIKRDALIAFDKEAGTDFLGQSRKAFLAEQKGYSAKPWDKPSETGIHIPFIRELSSAITSRAAIPTAKGISKGMEVAGDAASKIKIAAPTINILNRIINDESQSPERRKAAQAALDKIQGENQ